MSKTMETDYNPSEYININALKLVDILKLMYTLTLFGRHHSQFDTTYHCT